MTPSIKNQVLSGVIWSTIRIWGNRLGGILIFFILARILSPEDFGIYSAVWAILLFLEVFTEQGFADAIIQRPEIEKKQINSVFLMNLGMSLIIFLSIWLLAPSIALWMHMPKIELPLKIAGFAIIFNALGFCQLAMCRRKFQYRWLAIRTLLATLISGGIGITLAIAGYGVWALIVQFVTASIINLILLWMRPLWLPSFEFSLKGLMDLMRFSVKLMISRLFDATSSRAFELAIGAWMGAVTLGIYSVGARVYTIVLQLLSSVVLDVAHSGFSRLAENKVRFTEAYYKAITVTVAISLPLFVLLSSVSQELCVAFFGNRWTESGSILQLLALLGAVQSVQYFNGAALNALGNTGLTLFIALLKALMTIFVLVIFGKGDLQTLVLAYVLGQIIVNPLSFLLAKKHVGFSWKKIGLSIWPYILGTTASYVVTITTKHLLQIDHVWIRLITLSTIGGGTYIAFVIAFAPHSIISSLRHLKQK